MGVGLINILKPPSKSFYVDLLQLVSDKQDDKPCNQIKAKTT
jgi:hypothetical protein